MTRLDVDDARCQALIASGCSDQTPDLPAPCAAGLVVGEQLRDRDVDGDAPGAVRIVLGPQAR
jgi:hypothetical protein